MKVLSGQTSSTSVTVSLSCNVPSTQEALYVGFFLSGVPGSSLQLCGSPEAAGTVGI